MVNINNIIVLLCVNMLASNDYCPLSILGFLALFIVIKE